MLVALGLTCLAACNKGPRAATDTRPSDSLDLGAGLAPRDSADSVLLAPRVVTGPTVLVFWLPAADSFPADDQAAALDDMTYYTGKVAPVLERYGIKLLPTNAETVFVALPNNKQRAILLSGLDYPFGYVIVEPGGTEQILAGVYADDELLDEIRSYFDLPEDTTSVRPRITT
ncbi:MAG TPA: hypothetical protein VGQ18_01810 [Gemmatimonadales bacterium]|jgi:hypothetical protein|nr:hypothetical protein [Gemmatimonadales bacterium]